VARIHVAFLDQIDNMKTTVELPDDVPMNQLIPALVDAMELPTVRGEHRIHYQLSDVVTGGRLADDKTLAQEGIEDGGVIGILPVMMAGGDVRSLTAPSSDDFPRDLLMQTVQGIARLGERLAGLEQALSVVEESQEAGMQGIGEQITSLKEDLAQQLSIVIAAQPRPQPRSVESRVLPDTALRPMAVSYLDFDIGLYKEGDKDEYRVESLWMEGGQRYDGSHRFTIPVSLTELDQDFLRNMGIVSRSASSSLDLARVLGQKLFDAVFGGTVRDCFQKCSQAADQVRGGVRVRLDLLEAPELINYPWELLWHNTFLAQDLYTPVVRYLRSATPMRLADIKPPYRMLVAMASAAGYPPLNIDKEKSNLEEALESWRRGGLLEIQWLEHATLIGLRQALTGNNGPHILHYVGHGGFGEREGGYLALERATGAGEIMTGDRLAALVHNCRNIRLVTLNTCRGARSKATDPFASIALELMRHGAPAVVAMQHEILDDAAICFSRQLYECLANGESIYWAISNARLALFNDQGYDIEWFIPVLYSSSPDGVVFGRSSQATAH
jgi:hypothetical protein